MKKNRHPQVRLGNRMVGPGKPAYIIAEVSANHNRSLSRAKRIIRAAKQAGADAVKVQAYTPDTLTIDSKKKWFRVGKGSLWEGQNLYQLYGKASMPWKWLPLLKQYAQELNIPFFSTAYDVSSVEFLEELGIPFHKIASFEVIDIPLIEKMAKTRKPILISTGMATMSEIKEAFHTAQRAGNSKLALLKCTSAYPATPDEMNLATIPDLQQAFACPVGLSDHSLETFVPAAAVALGACIIEKHLTLSRKDPGPDSAFSMEPDEFAEMVRHTRLLERAIGTPSYGLTKKERANRQFRKSLFVVKDVKKGELLNSENVRVIRPGQGLHPRFLQTVIGKRAARKIERGTPLQPSHIQAKGKKHWQKS